MENSAEKAERTYITITIGVLVGFIALCFLCYFGYRWYAHFEANRLVRRAAAFLSGGDARQAGLSARRAQQLDPNNLGPVRELAQISEAVEDKSALEWRRKACELNPGSIDDSLSLAECAIRFKELGAAEKALGTIPPENRETARFHAVSGQLAESRQNAAEAETQWKKAVEAEPSNKVYQLQYGALLARSADRQKQSLGGDALERLRADKDFRARATRALITSRLALRRDPEDTLKLTRELQAYSEATFTDRILYLDLLRQLKDPGFSQYLTTIESDAVSKPANLGALFSWMTANGMSLLAIDFSRTISPEKIDQWPVPVSIAEAYVRVADWPKLGQFVANRNWGRFEFLRRAYAALALRGQNKTTEASREWDNAQKDASSDAEFVKALCKTVSGWGWHQEATDLLWSLTKFPEMRASALRELYSEAIEAGDTPTLYRVLTRLVELEPQDESLQNNLVLVSLLVNSNVAWANKTAADLYHRDSSNVGFASTYAFALYSKGDQKGALNVMEQIGPDKLQEPSLAAYYGLFLAANGEKEKARTALELAETGKLLPEEKLLVKKARSEIELTGSQSRFP